MKGRRTYHVKELAAAAGVSVRTLHHYDAIGLLVPRGRSQAGYRLYDEQDVLRLQQIVIARELGLSLEVIRRSLDDPDFDYRRALAAQRQELVRRLHQTESMVRSIDAALARLDPNGNPHTQGGETMDVSAWFQGFHPAAHEAEARERWGGTAAYAESARRTKRYTETEWRQIAAEQAAIYDELAAAKTAGRAPADPAVRALVERHRLWIDRWFYPCTPAHQERLAELYEGDERFAANIERHAAGLTAYLVAAIREQAHSR